MTPEQQVQLAEKTALHMLNAQAHSLNKGIIQKSATMQDVQINKDIYTTPIQQQPPATSQPPVQPQIQQQVPVQQPQVQQIVQQDLTPLIDRVTALEKQVTKFVNLIERSVAKNAKEINIRIKLNENNDSTNKQ